MVHRRKATCAFEQLGLLNIFLQVVSVTAAGIRAHERAGFREIGRRRRAWFTEGQRYDMVMMDLRPRRPRQAMSGRTMLASRERLFIRDFCTIAVIRCAILQHRNRRLLAVAGKYPPEDLGIA